MGKQEGRNVVHSVIQKNTGIITINRPDRLNAINDDVIQQLNESFKILSENEKVSSIILTGSGNKAFCSGADLKDPKIGNTELYSKYLESSYQPIIQLIMDLSIPVIAAINGAVVGAGIGLALACDYVIMDKEAFYYPAFLKIGLIPDTGVMTFLVRRLGKYRAFEIISLAKRISSEDALKWGLTNKITESGQLMEEALKIAKDLSLMPKIAIGLVKQMANRAEEMSLEEAFKMECDFQEIAANTEDHLEGVKAFLEKRDPEFKGK